MKMELHGKRRALKRVIRYLNIMPNEMNYASRLYTSVDCAIEETRYLLFLSHVKDDKDIIQSSLDYLKNVKYSDLRKDILYAKQDKSNQ